MLGILRLYGETFKDCFSKIEDTLIQKQNEFYSDAYLDALISTYRSGFQTAYLNKIIESNIQKPISGRSVTGCAVLRKKGFR